MKSGSKPQIAVRFVGAVDRGQSVTWLRALIERALVAKTARENKAA